MKYCSRLIALLLAVTLLMTNVIIAEGQSWEDTTLADLQSAYTRTANQERTPYVSEDLVLGLPLTIKAFETVVDKSECSFTWYSQDSTEPVGTGNVLELRVTLAWQVLTCKMTKNGEVIGTQVFNIAPAQTTDLEEYLNVLYTPVDEYEDTTEIDKARNYEYMLIWNTTVADGNLAELVLNAWKAEEEYAFFDNTVLCSCVLNGVESSEYVLHPDGAHLEGCGWHNGLTLDPDAPVDPDQPPLYEGKPEGNQYTETLEYTLPMEEDRAVILQTGARAILTSESTTPGVWQVYTGNEWVDIQGDNTNVIEVTEAKLNTIFELTGIAQLRYFDKTNSVVLDEVSVTTEEIANGEYVDLPEQLSLITRAEGSDVETADGKYYVYVYYVYGADSKHAGKTVADPMIAEVSNEQAYQKTVESPVIPGYAPDQTKVEIDVTKDSETKVFYVYYSPTTVEFKVKHYQQNLLNDDYTLAATDEKTGKTEDSVGQDLEKDTANTEGWKGFYALLYDDTTEIAADGSTVIEIYYDRNYYLMKFDANGGYGAESIFARVGAGIGTPKQPTRAGYTFAGWLDEDDENGTVYTTANFPYTTMPAKNTSFVAQWTSIQTSYDVVFWYENADDDGYSQAGVLNDVAANSGDIVNGADYANTNFTGKDAEHFTYSHADQNVVVKGDGSTVVNVYFSRNVYTLTFVMDNWANSCSVEIHRHTDACNQNPCDKEEHTHDDSCVRSLTCTVKEHVAHTADCLKCDYAQEHNHGESCYAFSCTEEVHTTHTTSCYEGVGSAASPLYPPDNPTNGLVYRGNFIINYSYIYVNGQWYNYSGSASNGSTAPTICHEHSDYTGSCYTLTCTTPEHSHSDECYKDELHTHDATCYTYSCGKEEHTHSDSCSKCMKHEHYHSGNTCYLVVEAKYDADITDVWQNNPVKAVLDAGNAFQWSATNAQVSYMEKMPGDNTTMTKYNYSGSRTYYWRYYLETLPGKEYDSSKVVTYGDKTYFEYDDSTIHYSNTLYLTYDDDYYDITGFDQLYDKGEGGWYKDGSSWRLDFTYNDSTKRYEANLYYTRNSYDLTFSNNGDVVEGKGGSFLYEADISGQYFVPDYPADLEAGAYTFDGWYTSPFFGDTKFEFTTTDEDGNTVNTTMPAKDITLYARWVPITHEVNIYQTEGGTQIGSDTVDHNDQATEVADPTNGKYTFVGWFYKENGVEKAFDFSMPITKDMEIYAKWISNTLMPYTIKYAVQKGTDENGKPIYEYIAADTTGSALAGTTKTFQAKYGDELDTGYQTGYFPHTNSHSLVIDIEDETKNVFTFVYTPATKAPYTVYYLAEKLKDGGTSLGTHPVNGKTYYIIAETKTVAENTMVAVSEKYKYVQGYMPDAIQKQLILSADPADNVLYFFYTVDDKHAPVQIVHYVQNATGEDYSIYQNYSATTHTIGEVIRESTLDITGFKFVRANKNGEAATVTNGVVTATLTAEGLLLELYYDRILYDYEFKFLDQDTNKPVAAPETGKARYGASVSQDAKDVTGYTLVSAETQIVVIDDETTNNVRIFYYTENEVTINYIAVTKNTSGEWVEEDATGGTVQVGTVAAGATATDTVAMVTGEASGSTAAASSNTYKFVGWYKKDANGYKEVLDADGNHITTPTFVPKKPGEVWESTTYYALFDWNMGSLTITKNGLHAGESAIFKVEAESVTEGEQTYYIVLSGNANMNSATITNLAANSEYTVTEQSSWSWSYTPKGDPYERGTITAGATVTETFTNNKTDKWLHDENGVINDFKADENDTTFGMSDVDN